MADGSSIEWTDATWQITTGCSVVSPGCTNCYAQQLAGTRLRHHPAREGLTSDSKAGPVWNGQVRFNEQWLEQPLKWKRPRKIFVSAHGDLFHEAIPDEWIDRVFAVMALAPQHTFQVLTKRAERMRDYVRWVIDNRQRFTKWAANGAAIARDVGRERTAPPRWPLPNVWLGVSVEDQVRADERIPLLLDTPAAKRFISAEPLLGPIDLGHLRASAATYNALAGLYQDIDATVECTALDWVIVGGESGPHARPMHPDWARSLRDQCRAAGVPFFFKQYGNWHHFTGTQPPTPSEKHRWLAPDGRILGASERECDQVERLERKAGEPLFSLWSISARKLSVASSTGRSIRSSGMSDERDEFPWDDHDDDDELTDEEMAMEECGRWNNGKLTRHCTKAGSEECDWICPLRDHRADA
jgi:protein gp37